VRQLLPDPLDPVDPLDAYAAERPPHADGRPWLAVCMVQSLDGSTVVDATSGALSSPADTAVLGALRHHADVILVGAGTAREERYGAPRRAGQRIAVVSRSGRLDPGSGLVTSGAAVLVLPTDGPEVDVETIRAGTGTVDLTAALVELRRRFGARFVHAEGGPRLNGALARAGLVDEWNVTIAPAVVGGAGPRLVDGAPDLGERLRVAHVLEDEGFLFVRALRAR
jgi:riboflavin biosynthesis pyrimidine reductase